MKNEIIEWIKTIVLSVVIALLITAFIKPTIVRQHSMSPTLQEYDFLIINRLLYNRTAPQNGDIVVFQSTLKTAMGKDKLLIKRIIAVPGDELLIEDGIVYLNGRILDEPYLVNGYTEGKATEGNTILIPEGKLFAMGDNRNNSMDSRDEVISLVDIDDIVGKAFLRLYPLNKIGFLK
ncbi:signal peptidase I [Alkaliphilus peptidifermentans]|uniref:Signal peptidase I n=1 Tax=Alkaliphilus peptidifermentans DSM 18978 TaxID=1120976 RepID=A0A1G5K4V9_9FIRM|nr:signal peptidase I [Alkaliphilus peptidifermentans]SCY95090.1 signal peptidase I [Alkaliphilus peptidifermentans DSM 18978]